MKNSVKLEIVKRSQEDAQNKLNTPLFKEALQKFAETSCGLTDSFKRMADSIQIPLQTLENFYKSNVWPSSDFSDTEIFFTPSPQPVTFEEVEYILDRKISQVLKEQNSSNEIVFTKDKELIRTVSGKRLEYVFTGNKKRVKTFESIISGAGNYVSTETLRTISNSPTEDALRKVVQGINGEAKTKLNIKERLIHGRRGYGYRINKNLSIIKE